LGPRSWAVLPRSGSFPLCGSRVQVMERREIMRLFRQLCRQSPHKFPTQRAKLDAPYTLGVYVIYDPENRVVHVAAGAVEWATFCEHLPTTLDANRCRERVLGSENGCTVAHLTDTAHVGRTPYGRRGLHKRLYDHLCGASSFTREYLKGDGSQLRGAYSFQ